MLLECHNCGAPLDVASGASTVKCNYCGQTSKSEQYKTVAFETPKDWKPPTEWKPSAESTLRDAVLVYKPAVNAARAVIRALVFSGVATVALGGFIAYQVTSSVNRATSGALSDLTQPAQVGNAVAGALALASRAALSASQAARNAGRQAGAAGSLPLVCSGNESLALEGTSYELSAGIPILAAGNCTLRLTRCTVSGTTAITVKNNATVIVEGGSLTGRGPAVIVSDNGKLEASGGALVTGEPAVVATGNAAVTLRGASVSGKHVAISATGLASVDTDGAAIQGLVTGKRKKR